jgi:protocatechuate 3,4-dioxygenase beta subunit
MRTVLAILVVLSILTTACASTEPQLSATSIPTETALIPTPELATATPALTELVASSATPVPEDDFFTQMGITLPAPREACAGLTQPQTEGPYYKADTPQRSSFYENGMPGTRLILVGYVLNQNCQPLPNAWLDFWQADANGEYDNAGYRLRGHQFTDAQGRYYLETILPGLYSSRPIEHIHVKVRPEGGQEITSQLYFPQQAVEGLTVTLEDRGDHMVGYFTFVVQN